MDIVIEAGRRILRCGDMMCPVRIGRAGYIAGADGREGDSKTPLGAYHLRFGLYRADRLSPPPTALSMWPLRSDDGWCDASGDPAYNRFIRAPYPASHEVLWRDDGAYDILLVMSHNDSPPVSGLGSAVFIHIAQPDDRQTLGCIALTPDAMVALLPRLYTGQAVKVVA